MYYIFYIICVARTFEDYVYVYVHVYVYEYMYKIRIHVFVYSRYSKFEKNT
jgi:hypothetical protein